MVELDIYDEQAEYRNHISTVDEDGKRIWLYPKQPKGKFYDYRKYVSYVLLLILFVMPFIKVNGKPFMLFNVLESEFILFGVYFAPQDIHLFVVAMLIGIIGITLFTVIFGRLFCGWVCPQTIFMEMVFRRVEYWIEGDSSAQRKLDKADWNAEKIRKKVLKHVIFLLISAFIAHIFLSYIIGADKVYKLVSEPLSEHWQSFIAMVVFTLVFYGVFARLREQVCTTICPYGRMQSVLLDEDSLVVSYDFKRGDPRGKISRKRKNQPEVAEAPKGDCIDCGLCVRVCPTGIDIRNGTQLECVNCTACMDACDEIMTKVDRPTGLIRLDSYNRIIGKSQKIFTKRAAAYTGILVALIGLESFLLMSRSAVETLFLRTPGMLYQDNDDGYISNLYNYQLINKTDLDAVITFESNDVEGIIFEPVGKPPHTKPKQLTEGAVFIKIPKDVLKDRKTNLRIDVIANGEVIDRPKTSFLGPIK